LKKNPGPDAGAPSFEHMAQLLHVAAVSSGTGPERTSSIHLEYKGGSAAVRVSDMCCPSVVHRPRIVVRPN
jgi:hypothetical protein